MKNKKIDIDDQAVISDENLSVIRIKKSGLSCPVLVKDMPILQDGVVYLFVIEDILSRRATYPIPQNSIEMGVRYFLTLLSNEKPESRCDYSLYVTGEYDPVTACYSIYPESVLVKEGNKDNV